MWRPVLQRTSIGVQPRSREPAERAQLVRRLGGSLHNHQYTRAPGRHMAGTVRCVAITAAYPITSARSGDAGTSTSALKESADCRGVHAGRFKGE